mmetsp:Transcript_34283/g.99582  ORF Transcript_34283/g.99582 Transcript_34283/m.99582 type:complete len:91 (-) Transcript_34283:955-1227(-)
MYDRQQVTAQAWAHAGVTGLGHQRDGGTLASRRVTSAACRPPKQITSPPVRIIAPDITAAPRKRDTCAGTELSSLVANRARSSFLKAASF